MTDIFTQTIAQKLSDMLQQQGENLDDAQALQLTPQQVLEVISGNSDWLQQFEQQLDAMFRRVADNATLYWQETVELQTQALPSKSSELAEIFSNQNIQAGGFSLTGQNSSNGNSSSGLPNSNTPLSRVTAFATNKLLESLFNRSSSNQFESERSTQASTRYKASRGQIQAKLSQQLGRGNRYD